MTPKCACIWGRYDVFEGRISVSIGKTVEILEAVGSGGKFSAEVIHPQAEPHRATEIAFKRHKWAPLICQAYFILR